MVIDQCIQLLQEASQLPFFMWKHNYLMLRQSLIDDLAGIQSDNTTPGPAAKTLAKFIQLLSLTEPDEAALAEGFLTLNDIFQTSELTDQRLQQYERLSKQFSKRVNSEAVFEKLRANLKKTATAEQQQAYEQRLFNNEGLNYCLLYYLSYYHALTTINSKQGKQNFIQQTTVNFGSGDLPGIQQDFSQDECLEKFILLILDDATRLTLIREYYYCKQTIVTTKDVVAIEYTLHEFLFTLLTAFAQHSVIVAANDFFAPYGKTATIAQLTTLFKADYVPR